VSGAALGCGQRVLGCEACPPVFSEAYPHVFRLVEAGWARRRLWGCVGGWWGGGGSKGWGFGGVRGGSVTVLDFVGCPPAGAMVVIGEHGGGGTECVDAVEYPALGMCGGGGGCC